MTQFADISKWPEDKRIKFIGNLVMESRKSAWCLTDDEPDKPERYRRKMHNWFPLLVLGEEIKRGFPGPGCAGFTVNPPAFN